jgi:hypothetical protein
LGQRAIAIDWFLSEIAQAIGGMSFAIAVNDVPLNNNSSDRWEEIK